MHHLRSFCADYTLLSPYDVEPTFLANLLYDDAHRVVYCALPQASSIETSIMFLLLQEGYPQEQAPAGTPGRPTRKLRSLEDLSPIERNYRLKNYYKFMIVRNPLERLLAAYLDKVNNEEERLYYSNLKKEVVAWSRCGSQSDTLMQPPQFDEFINYYLSHYKLMEQDFKTALDVCSPCLVNYNFYAKYQVLNYHMDALLSLLGINKSYYLSNTHSAKHNGRPIHDQMDKLMSLHFSKLECDQKRRLLLMMADELEFYYGLYQEEAGMHLKYFPKD